MKYEYWFANIKEIGNKTKAQIRSKVKTAEELYNIEETALKNMEIPEETTHKILQGVKEWKLEEEYQKLIDRGVKFYTILDEEYPSGLKEITAPPYALYVKGKLPNEKKISVAMVGARECTTYGEIMARQYAETLADAGIQIISGMARGIDGISQKSALCVGGESYAVLGSGVDLCYPREHYALYTELQRKGGIISEQPLGTQPLPQFFPARNRIISGLSDVVIVIEAKEKSGSLITADMALEQGKDVYALPGASNSTLSRGCHNLIRQGAGILLSPKDLLEELGIFYKNKLEKNIENKILLESPEKLVYSCLDLYPKSLNQILEESKLTISGLMMILINLEQKGYIKETTKNYYVKVK